MRAGENKHIGLDLCRHFFQGIGAQRLQGLHRSAGIQYPQAIADSPGKAGGEVGLDPDKQLHQLLEPKPMQRDDKTGHVAFGGFTEIVQDIVRNDTVETVIKSRRAGRQIAAHAHANQHHAGGSRMPGQKGVHHCPGRLFPLRCKCQLLVTQNRTLAGSLIGKNVVAARVRAAHQREIQLFQRGVVAAAKDDQSFGVGAGRTRIVNGVQVVLTVRRLDALVLHAKRVKAEVECPDVFFERQRPLCILWWQKKFCGPQVIVRTQISLAPAHGIGDFFGTLQQPFTRLFPCREPTLGVALPDVLDRFQNLHGVRTIGPDVVERAQRLEMVGLVAKKTRPPVSGAAAENS